MKMYLISDNVDTLTGMRLAGVEGIIAHSMDELKAAVEDVIKITDIGIVLMTEGFGKKYPDYVHEIKQSYKQPLFIDIPDRHGTGRNPNFITDYVNEAIGLKI